MPALGFGLITVGRGPEDLQQKELTIPLMPWWIGRGSPEELERQQAVGKTLQAFIAYAQGRPETAPDLRLRPDATEEERAAAYYARSWIYDMDNAQIQALYPLVAAQTIQQVRQAWWIEGLDRDAMFRQTVERFQSDIPTLEQWAEVLNSYVDEIDRYLNFSNWVFKQFEVYLTWRAHHERKKQHRIDNITKTLAVVAEVAKYIPYVGWIIAIAVMATSAAVQVDRMRQVIKSLEQMGERVVVLQMSANALEASMATAPQARNLLAEILVAIAIREQYLVTKGASLPMPVRPGGVRDRSKGGGGMGTLALVGGGLAAAALALVAAVR
jgi:hypothetical protein